MRVIWHFLRTDAEMQSVAFATLEGLIVAGFQVRIIYSTTDLSLTLFLTLVVIFL